MPLGLKAFESGDQNAISTDCSHPAPLCEQIPWNFLGTLIGLFNEYLYKHQRELTCAIYGIKKNGSEENESFDGTK